VKASAPKTSSLKQGLKSSFSSGGKFSLGGAKKLKTDDALPEISQTEKLDVLDGVISEIEESKKPSSTQKPEPQQPVEEPKEESVQKPPLPQEEPLAEIVQPQQPMGAVAQVLPQALHQTPTPPTPQSSKKETFVSAYTAPETTPDFGGGVQVVEQEKSPEVPPEVESFLQHAQDHAAKLPEEIVIADNQEISKVTHHPKTPVLVLPITPEEEKLGKKKSPKFSIRWLVEWSYKMMKKFSGKVVYRMD